MRVTVYDIALKLGLSPSTVSRVLNGSMLISEERKEQILEAARTMGYCKRTIKRHTERSILNVLLVLPVQNERYLHLFYDISELISGITEGFGTIRIHIITRLGDRGIIQGFKKIGDIDCVIFAFTTGNSDLLGWLEKRSIPAVFLNRSVNGHSSVLFDITSAISSIVQTAVQKKYKNPCYIGFSLYPELSALRYKTVSQAFKNSGIAIPVLAEYSISARDEINDRFFTRLRKARRDIVFCFNDVIAVSLYHAAVYRRLSVPEDFALCGIDNSPVCELLEKKMTTVSFDIYSIGKQAAEILKNMVINKDREPRVSFCQGLAVRGETL